MIINYIILAHKQPKQIKKLIEALLTNNTRFFIHVDKNVDIEPFITEVIEMEYIEFLPDNMRRPGVWGGVGIVEATINALDYISRKDLPGYSILLSGQDYPIKSNSEIEKFLSDNKGTNFINAEAMPWANWWPEPDGMARLEMYKIDMSVNKLDFVLLYSIMERKFYTKASLKNILTLIKRGKVSFFKKILKKRKHPSYLKPFAGYQWWALYSETVKLMLDFLKQHSDYIKYHKYSILSDEIFFQSVLKAVLAENVILQPSLTYINWSKKNVELPVTFVSEDFNELLTQPTGKLFARKFDLDKDEQIFELINSSRKNNL
jgi:hypothetical protein